METHKKPTYDCNHRSAFVSSIVTIQNRSTNWNLAASRRRQFVLGAVRFVTALRRSVSLLLYSSTNWNLADWEINSFVFLNSLDAIVVLQDVH